MSNFDWLILGGTLLYIVLFGVWKSRGIKTTEDYLLGKRELKWWTIGLSIVATQASAITFLSTPGQAYVDGMRFVQFYFGMPFAMVILAAFVIPLYYKLKVYTAYEFLESRFDVNTRILAAFLFLVQRGLAAGIVIYAPAIILSSILGWSLNWTILLMGIMVIVYTVAGGTNAVSQTQKQQMIIILAGMFVAFLVMIYKLPSDVSFGQAVKVAGKMGRLNVVDFSFDLSNRYNVWSGILGGTFLFLSYFGTDQSQVQRYLSGRSLRESRLGLLFNGIFKVPMQFSILFIGAMMFVFYQFHQPPVFFNKSSVEQVRAAGYESELNEINDRHTAIFEAKEASIRSMISAMEANDESSIALAEAEVQTRVVAEQQLREETKALISKVEGTEDPDDADYVFITFILTYLPHGLIGLLLAVIFSAAMSTTASELNALATTTTIDFYKRVMVKNKEDAHYLKASKGFTIMWGLIALSFAASASLFDNLIEAVNIIGSVFYGTILGIFLVAFFFKFIGSKAVFIAAIIAEILVITIYVLDNYEVVSVAYLWLNLIGCVLVIGIATILEAIFGDKNPNLIKATG
ncbi:MAG: sodium:solute symporter [Bacteroidota bacterium]